MEETWAAFSDTDRFTRVGRLGHRVEERLQDDGQIMRVGRMRELGLNLEWYERVFDYTHLVGFRVEREFLNGPARGYVLDVNLQAQGEGTEVHYRVRGFARYWWLWPVTWLVFHLRVRRSLDRALALLMDGLRTGVPAAVQPSSPLSQAAQRRLVQACDPMEDLAVASLIRSVLTDGSDLEQDRLEPMKLAQQWDLPLERVLDGCLRAVQSGVLSLRWDLICPSCHWAMFRQERLDISGEKPHCTSCNIYYDVDLADHVVVSFRTTLREVDTIPACLGNPSATPHILGRKEIPSGGIECFELRLDIGRYRIRLIDDLCGADLVVGQDGPSSVSVGLETDGFAPELNRASAGMVSIWVRNVTQQSIRVGIEDTSWTPEGVTLAQILMEEKAKGLLPAGALPPELDINIQSYSVVSLERLHEGPALVDALRVRLDGRESEWEQQSGRVISMGWPTLSQALLALRQLIGCHELCCSLSMGTVLRVSHPAGTHYGGRAMEQGRKALAISIPGGSSVTQEGIESPDFQAQLALKNHVERIIPGPQIRGRKDQLLQFTWTHQWRSQSTLKQIFPETFVGRTFRERYHLSEVLGEGGYGTVFSATDMQCDEDVVVKVLHPNLTSDGMVAQSFFDEARACMALEHPNVVHMSDFGHTQDGFLFCVMEYLVGRTLSEVPEKIRNVELTCMVALDVAKGLCAAHALGLIHRDIKPSNIFVTRNKTGRPMAKILDFGIAMHVGEKSPLERNGEIVGSTPYISPEQIQGIPASPSSDIYALGMVMYRSFVGSYPFSDLDSVPQLMRRASVDVPSVGEDSRYSLPPDLVALIDRSLARDPHHRPSTARAFAEELHGILKGRV